MTCALEECFARDSVDWSLRHGDSDEPKAGTQGLRPLSDRHPFDDAELRRRVGGDDPR
jgi:hypothetical protein